MWVSSSNLQIWQFLLDFNQGICMFLNISGGTYGHMWFGTARMVLLVSLYWVFTLQTLQFIALKNTVREMSRVPDHQREHARVLLQEA